MPVILKNKDENTWLDKYNNKPENLKGLLTPYPGEIMISKPEYNYLQLDF